MISRTFINTRMCTNYKCMFILVKPTYGKECRSIHLTFNFDAGSIKQTFKSGLKILSYRVPNKGAKIRRSVSSTDEKKKLLVRLILSCILGVLRILFTDLFFVVILLDKSLTSNNHILSLLAVRLFL